MPPGLGPSAIVRIVKNLEAQIFFLASLRELAS